MDWSPPHTLAWVVAGGGCPGSMDLGPCPRPPIPPVALDDLLLFLALSTGLQVTAAPPSRGALVLRYRFPVVGSAGSLGPLLSSAISPGAPLMLPLPAGAVCPAELQQCIILRRGLVSRVCRLFS